jgi:hypothetical protein
VIKENGFGIAQTKSEAPANCKPVPRPRVLWMPHKGERGIGGIRRTFRCKWHASG